MYTSLPSRFLSSYLATAYKPKILLRSHLAYSDIPPDVTHIQDIIYDLGREDPEAQNFKIRRLSGRRYIMPRVVHEFLAYYLS